MCLLEKCVHQYLNMSMCMLSLANKIHPSLSALKKQQYECFPSLKLVETDSANTHQNIEYYHQPHSLPRSSPPSPFTQSNALSVHKHKLNLLLMIALLTRRGSIHSRKPATTIGQISRRERGEQTLRKPEMERQQERI